MKYVKLLGHYYEQGVQTSFCPQTIIRNSTPCSPKPKEGRWCWLVLLRRLAHLHIARLILLTGLEQLFIFSLDSLTLFSPNSLMFSLSCQPRASERGRVEAQYLYGYLYPQGIAKVRLYLYIYTDWILFSCLKWSRCEEKWKLKHQKFNKWLRSSLKQTPAQYYHQPNNIFLYGEWQQWKLHPQGKPA